MNTFTKPEVFLSVFVQKPCSVNGVLKSLLMEKFTLHEKCISFFQASSRHVNGPHDFDMIVYKLSDVKSNLSNPNANHDR